MQGASESMLIGSPTGPTQTQSPFLPSFLMGDSSSLAQSVQNFGFCIACWNVNKLKRCAMVYIKTYSIMQYQNESILQHIVYCSIHSICNAFCYNNCCLLLVSVLYLSGKYRNPLWMQFFHSINSETSLLLI